MLPGIGEAPGVAFTLTGVALGGTAALGCGVGATAAPPAHETSNTEMTRTSRQSAFDVDCMKKKNFMLIYRDNRGRCFPFKAIQVLRAFQCILISR